MLDLLKFNLNFIGKWGKRVFLVLAVYIAAISLFLHFHTTPALPTQNDSLKDMRTQIYQSINNKELQKTKDGQTFIFLYRASFCGLVGEACTNNPSDGDKYFGRSLFGRVTNLTVLPFANPPASGVYWAYSGLSGAGFVPHSLAAEGIGFTALKPLLNVWKIFRDVSYLILVIVLVAIGFMIMFRTKVNEQTVISVENALPRIVIVLILITFSFAIAGFMIDLMYITISIVISVLAKNTIHPFQAADYQNKVFGGGANQLFDLVFFNSNIWDSGAAIFSIMPSLLAWFLRISITFGLLFGVAHIFPLTQPLFDPTKNLGDVWGLPGLGVGILAIVTNVLAGGIFGSISSLILSLIIVVFTGLLVFFRIFFLLFAAYLRIILGLIFSPLIFLMDAIPGRNFFFKWLKHLVADLLAFPITVAMIILSDIIVKSSRANLSAGSGLTPTTPTVGAGQLPLWTPPFLTSTAGASISTLIGIGILFMIPDIVKSIRGLFGIKESPIKAGIGTFFGGAAGAGGLITGAASKYGQIGYFAHYLPKGVMNTIGRRAPFLKDYINIPEPQPGEPDGDGHG